MGSPFILGKAPFDPGKKYKKLSGDVKHWTRKGDSGKDVTYSNCGKSWPTLLTMSRTALTLSQPTAGLS